MATLHPATHLGYVHLTVSNLERSLAYYREALGFRLHERNGASAHLGAGGDDLLRLTENPGAKRAGRTTGLYHFAILVPSRLALAESLQHLIDTQTPIGGASDHLVSEALYLSDPDGNGIEIYRDRPRSTWNYDGDQVKMAVDPFDADGVLAELEPERPSWSGLHPDTVLGHMHLHVGNLSQAEAFYHDVVGFNLMAHYGSSAAFLSAGGYHHHLGINTWNGVGAPPPAPDTVGLRYFVIRLPDSGELDNLAGRAQEADIASEERDAGLFLCDPSQNGLLFVAG